MKRQHTDTVFCLPGREPPAGMYGLLVGIVPRCHYLDHQESQSATEQRDLGQRVLAQPQQTRAQRGQDRYLAALGLGMLRLAKLDQIGFLGLQVQ